MKNKIITGLVLVVGLIILLETLALIKLKLSVNSYKNYWDKGNSLPIDDAEQLYIALGDSAAQGIGASKPQKGYVGLISTALTKKGQPVHTINLSVSGAKLNDVIDAQIPKLQELPINNNTILTLDIGGNDMRDFRDDDFRIQMEKLLAQLPKQTIVADVPYFGGGRFQNLEPNVSRANAIIKELLYKYSLSHAELHEITKERNNIFVNAADIFHPSDRGYRNWYDAFARVIGL